MQSRYLFTDTGRRARRTQAAIDVSLAVVVGALFAYLAASFI